MNRQLEDLFSLVTDIRILFCYSIESQALKKLQLNLSTPIIRSSLIIEQPFVFSQPDLQIKQSTTIQFETVQLGYRRMCMGYFD